MAKPKFLSSDGVRTLVTYIKEKLATKVDKEPGKSLSDNNYSDADVAKLESIESGAQENLIESISINSVAQAINDKNVNIAIPLVDATLKNAGQSADAKATGDAIAEVNQSLSQTATAIRQEFDNADNQLAEEMNQALEDLSGTIPTKTSELSNDSDYTTKGYVDDEIAGVESAIPTKTSQLQNDSDYTTKQYVDGELDTLEASIPTKVSQLQNDSSYATTTQLTDGLATKEDALQYGTATAEDVGKAMMPKTVVDGKVTSWEFGEAGKVDDVQINGTSVLENKVANIPIAGIDKLGAVLVNPIYGISVSGFNGDTYINKADLKLIKEGSNIYRPIVPYNQHESAFYGLAKAAGDATQSSSSNAVGAYTDEAKTKIQAMLGVDEFNFSDRIAKGVDDNGNIVNGAIIEGNIQSNKASGAQSHAEGASTTASGKQSHAEGASTIANHKSQHVFGEFNIADPSSAQATNKGTYVEIVGNGSSTTRSNARTLDWNGNEVLAGKLTVGANPTNTMDVSTKGYVDTAVSQCMGVADIDATLSTTGKAADAKAVGDEISDIKADLDNIFIKQFVEKNIVNIDNVVKLSGYSFGPAGSAEAPKVSGSANTSYDSYYFYTSKDTAMYFTSATPSAPVYISLTVGYNPSKTWNTVGGQMQMFCQNVTRKRKSENNLPTSAAQMDVSEAIVILTVSVSTTTSFYINSNISLSSDIGLPLEQTTGQSTTKAMSQKAITEAINGKVPMLKYTSGGSGFSGIEHVDIYIPTFDGYIDYWFAHNKNTETNSDIWRIDAAYMVDDSLANPVAFTTTGEWEIAIKLEGRSDFSGGYIHGDEVYTDIVFIVDGTVVDITDYTTATPFESLCILQKSNMYDPNDSTTVFGVHTSEHSFSKGTDKIQINQSLLWSGDYTLGYSYMGMFPISRTVSDCWYSNKDYLPEAISNGYRTGITKAVLLKESTKTIGQFISEQLPTLNSRANKSFNITDNGGTSYNKCYYILCGNDGTASSGDLWESKTIYALSKGV